MESKNNTNELIHKTETDSEAQKTNFRSPKGNRERTNQRHGIHIHALAHVRQVTNRGLLCSTGKYVQYPVITSDRK